MNSRVSQQLAQSFELKNTAFQLIMIDSSLLLKKKELIHSFKENPGTTSDVALEQDKNSPNCDPSLEDGNRQQTQMMNIVRTRQQFQLPIKIPIVSDKSR